MKRVINKIIFGFIIIACIGFIYSNKNIIINNLNYIFQSPCERTINYKIGQIDPQFNLSEDTVKKDLSEASGIWNSVSQKTLLSYDSEAELTVNLIYDERQESIDRINNIQEKVDLGKTSLENEVVEYESLVAGFQARAEQFNNDVLAWNNIGGAPENIFNDLSAKQAELKDEAEKLNNIGKKLNLSVNKYNLDINKLNQTVQEYNEDIIWKPEEGVYIYSQNIINVYLNKNQNEFIHTMAHELGHALGLEHITNDPKSIMYPYTSQEIKTAETDIKELNNLCKHGSLYEMYKMKTISIINEFIKSFKLMIDNINK